MRAFDEMIQQPNDDTQNGWLQGLEYLLFKGQPILQASTEEELRRVYGEHAGLFVRCFLTSKIDRQRKVQALSLDEYDAEDEREEQALLVIEDYDLLHDPRLSNLNEETREAVSYFIMTWLMHESGQKIPGHMLTKLSRYRKKVGLPLVLR